MPCCAASSKGGSARASRAGLGRGRVAGRVDGLGVIRWVEVCYCPANIYGVAMHEELSYLAEFLTDIEVADARSPLYCKGYPECNDCACTRKSDLRGAADGLSAAQADEPEPVPKENDRPPRWLGWLDGSPRTRLGKCGRERRRELRLNGRERRRRLP